MGPPADPRDATKMMTLFFSKEGKKIVCGGTTPQIAADYLHETIVTSLDYGTDPAIPPVGHMKGVDLVTEGVITMSRVVEYAKAFVEGTDLTNLWSVQTDGASQIAQLLFEYATDINFLSARPSIRRTRTRICPLPRHQNTPGTGAFLNIWKRWANKSQVSYLSRNPPQGGVFTAGGFSYTDNNHTADMEINRR